MLDKICEACYNYLILLSARDPRGPIVKKKMVGRVRFELTTNSLKGYCSTIELPTHSGRADWNRTSSKDFCRVPPYHSATARLMATNRSNHRSLHPCRNQHLLTHRHQLRHRC